MAIISSVDLAAGHGDNLGMYIILVDHDPVVTATLAPAGSFLIRSSDKRMFRKVDDGSTTNVVPIIDLDYNRFDLPTPGTITIVTANVYQTPTGYSWTTPTLKGQYRLRWGVTLDRANSGGSKSARLYNVTDASVLQNTFWMNSGNNLAYFCFTEEKVVEFLNAAKTFSLELSTDTNNRVVGYRGFFIELMRVIKETA